MERKIEKTPKTQVNRPSGGRTFNTVLIVTLALWLLGGAAFLPGNHLSEAAATSGIDSAGVYVWGDNSEDFCTFDWYVVPGATTLSLGYGALSATIPIGFEFPYYFETYNAVQVYSGGFLGFESMTAYDATQIGRIPQESPAGIIAGLWSDLDPDAGGSISYGTMGAEGDRSFVLTFEDVPTRSSTDLVTFQIVLFEGTGNFWISVMDPGESDMYARAIGFSDPHGVAGEQILGPQPEMIPALSSLCMAYSTDYMDPDGDMLPYFSDNCPLVDNVNQEDADGDGIGDACDACPEDADNDIDGDAVCGDEDNCPTVANGDQADSDGDGIGDTCDPCPDSDDVDTDGDGVCDLVDNCPEAANTEQADSDGDGMGDACDPCPDSDDVDTDRDGVCDLVDNCPEAANTDQQDSDDDGLGDACDDCPFDEFNDVDEDGVCGDVDVCPDVYDPDQEDADGDGIGDLCDDDTKSGDDDDSSGCGCAILGAHRSGTPHILVLSLLLGLATLRRRRL